MATRAALTLNGAIALAQQQFRELLRLQPIDQLRAGEFGDGAKRKRIDSLLDSLSSIARRIEGLLSEQIRSADASPFLTLPAPHAAFLREEFLPNATAIHKAYLQSSGLDVLLGLFDDDTGDTTTLHTIKNALWFAVEYTDFQLDEEDDRRISVDIAREVLDEGWFQPDFWRQNMRLLRPALIGRDEMAIPTHVRVRLAEVHRAFMFGAWMAAIALSRAIAEFALINRASYIGFAAMRKDRDGVERYRKLDDLIELASEKRPDLRPGLKVLQDAGNRVLHPKKHQNVIALPNVLKSEALDCVKHIVKLVEMLYAGEPLANAG